MTEVFKLTKEVKLTKEEFIKELREKVTTKFSRGDIVWMESEKIGSVKEKILAIVVHPYSLDSSCRVRGDHVKVGTFNATDGWYETWLPDSVLTLEK